VGLDGWIGWKSLGGGMYRAPYGANKWHGITKHDMTWRGLSSHSVTRHGITCHDIVWHNIKWHGVTRHDMVWHDIKWHGMPYHHFLIYSSAAVHIPCICLHVRRVCLWQGRVKTARTGFCHSFTTRFSVTHKILIVCRNLCELD